MPAPSREVGRMRHRLVWQQLPASSPALDPMNEVPDSDYSTVATIWGRVEPLAGMELYNALQRKGTTSHKITIRNRGAAFPMARPTDRFLFEATGRILNVDFVYRVDERNAYIALHCTEQMAQQ